jgi:hypothetical protein
MKRRSQQNRPALESLEGRLLLNAQLPTAGSPSTNVPQVVGVSPLADRQVRYTTPEGTHVLVQLFGAGSLKGSTVAPDGSLNLVFSNTTATGGIVAKVHGGTGEAKLRSISNGNSNILDLSGTGSSPIGPVKLRNFDLVPGGDINLTGGVGKLFLNSMGANSQIHAKELPVVAASTSTGSSSSFASASSSSSSSSNGLGTATGVLILVNQVNGAARTTPALGPPQIFGYDPTANALIRFNADTGAQLQTIPLSGIGTAISGVAMARDNGAQVVLIGDGTTIQAFDAVAGAFVGQFTTSNLAALGFKTVDGIGSTDFQTVITDASAGVDGLALQIDVGQSLATGQAVPIGAPFAAAREFEFSGGATGVAASDTIYVTGAAHFDTFQPNLTQFGIMAISTAGNKLVEASRTAVTAPKSIVNTGPPGTARSHPIQGLGSIDQQLALITGVSKGMNNVTLYNPKTLVAERTITLADPNRLSALSESFHPELAGDALVDVQGDVQTFRALTAQGLVLNVSGGMNLVQIAKAADSFIIARPVQHVNIPDRTNVIIESTVRLIVTSSHSISIGNRGGVNLIDPTLRVMGPLSLPND